MGCRPHFVAVYARIAYLCYFVLQLSGSFFLYDTFSRLLVRRRWILVGLGNLRGFGCWFDPFLLFIEAKLKNMGYKDKEIQTLLSDEPDLSLEEAVEKLTNPPDVGGVVRYLWRLGHVGIGACIQWRGEGIIVGDNVGVVKVLKDDWEWKMCYDLFWLFKFYSIFAVNSLIVILTWLVSTLLALMPRVSLQSEKDRFNVDIYRGFIEKFSLF